MRPNRTLPLAFPLAVPAAAPLFSGCVNGGFEPIDEPLEEPSCEFSGGGGGSGGQGCGSGGGGEDGDSIGGERRRLRLECLFTSGGSQRKRKVVDARKAWERAAKALMKAGETKQDKVESGAFREWRFNKRWTRHPLEHPGHDGKNGCPEI